MTTIAWDGKHLSADKAVHLSTGAVFPVTKVYRLSESVYGDILFGACGTADDAGIFLDWLRGERLELKVGDTSNTHAIVVTSDKVVHSLTHTGGLTPIQGSHYAIGEGAEMALGAMYAGLSSKKALKLLIGKTSGVMLGVDSVSFEGPVPAMTYGAFDSAKPEVKAPEMPVAPVSAVYRAVSPHNKFSQLLVTDQAREYLLPAPHDLSQIPAKVIKAMREETYQNTIMLMGRLASTESLKSIRRSSNRKVEARLKALALHIKEQAAESAD